MTEEKKAPRKKIKAAGEMQRIMSEYFYELNDAAKTRNRKIAWCTSVGPAEILRAMGFLVHFPENHGAMLGATRMSTDFIPAANALGYSPEICSYLTADIGSYVKGITPLSKAINAEMCRTGSPGTEGNSMSRVSVFIPTGASEMLRKSISNRLLNKWKH